MRIVQISFFAMLLAPFFWGLYGYFRSRRSAGNSIPVPQDVSNRALLINSAVLYALAFNIIFFIQELFLALGKRWLGLEAYLYHNNHSWRGDHPMDALAQGYGALAIFITGIICLTTFLLIKHRNGQMRLFLLWIGLQGVMQSLPQVPVAILAPDTDVGQAFIYLKISQRWGVALSWISMALLISIGSYACKWLLEFVPSDSWVSSPANRWRYLLRIALFPALLGVLMIVPFRLPPIQQILSPVLVALISIPWILSNYWRETKANARGGTINEQIYAAPIACLILLLLIFQILLRPGIRI